MLRVKVGSLAIVAVLPVVMAASCQTKAVMRQVRNVHVSVREAFRATDEFIAPRFEVAADLCLRRSETTHHADQCMEKWLQLDDVLSMVRESLASLEVVYENIERSDEGKVSWQYWILQVFRHSQSLVTILAEMNIDGADRVIEQIKNSIDGICQIVQCEGGE